MLKIKDRVKVTGKCYLGNTGTVVELDNRLVGNDGRVYVKLDHRQRLGPICFWPDELDCL